MIIETAKMILKKFRAKVDRSFYDSKRELEKSQTRIHKLDEIIQRLYEDNIEGKIFNERFAKMSENYEVEQKTLNAVWWNFVYRLSHSRKVA